MSCMLIIGSMSALGGPQIPQEVTDQIYRKAKELTDAGCAVSVSQTSRPGLFLYQRSPNDNLAKAIDMLKDFPHPLNIDLLRHDNPPNARALVVDLTQLCDLRVEQLSVSNVSLNPKQVECIGRMKSMTKLIVQNCPGFNDDGLRSLTKLEELELFGTDVTDAGLEPMTRIKTLNIEGGRVTGVGLSKLQDLDYLRLLSSEISNDGLGVIGSLPNLRNLSLKLGEHVDTLGLIRLSRAPRLETLSVWELSARTKIVGKELQAPNQFPQLIALTIDSNDSSVYVCELISGLSGIGTKSLQSINLNCPNLDDEVFDSLRAYSRIPQTIRMSHCRITNSGAMQFTSTAQCRIQMASNEFVNGERRGLLQNRYEAELRRKEAQLWQLRKSGRSSPQVQLEVDMLRRGERSGK